SGNAEMLFNMLQDLDEEFEGQVDVCLANVEVNQSLAEQYGISEVPTTLIINNGEVVDYFPGMLSKGRIRQKIEALLVY
ncbi:MAG: thioredoxin family protein, partial [Saprospiraceae bacterium]